MVNSTVIDWRLERIRDEAKRQGVDCIITSSPESVRYLTGAYVMTQKLIPERLAFAVVPVTGEAWMLVCRVEEMLVRAESHVKDVRTYDEFADDLLVSLGQGLRHAGLDGAVVAIEELRLSAQHYQRLKAELPRCTIVDASTIVSNVAQIKHDDEVAILAKATSLTVQAIDSAFTQATVGTSERAVGTSIMGHLDSEGLDEVWKVIGAGERSALAHPTPRADVSLRSGDLVRVDCGGVLDGFHSDNARNAIVGRNKQVERMYAKLAAIHEGLIESCTVGTRGSDLFSRCEKLFEKEDLPFTMPLIGHSLGIVLHEAPILTADCELVLKPNMVLAMEPRFTLDGLRYHIEDTVQVTEDGPRLLSVDTIARHPIFVE